MSGPDWDDKRVKAAFAARAAGRPGTPEDLPAAVLDRIVTEARRERPGRWRLPAFASLVAAVALATIVGVGQLGRTGQPSASGSGGTAADSGGVRASQASEQIFGTPIDVGAAVAIRDAGGDDRELLVSGFLARLLVPCPAPVDRVPNPTRIDCPGLFTWLMERPEDLTTTNSINAPTGPAIHPAFQMVDIPALGGVGGEPASPPAVTVAGHFDDRRAALCAQADDPPCRDTFVVDRLIAVDGRDLPVSTLSDVTVEPTSTSADIDRLVEAADPGATILSRQLRTGDGLGAVEPALAKDPAWTGQSLVWIVATVSVIDDRPTPRTFLVVDGSTDVDEITGAGVAVVLSAGATPPPHASSSTGALQDLLDDPISVADAIDHRDRHLDDTELAVTGTAWAPSTAIFCDFALSGQPALDQCPNTLRWISDVAPAPRVGDAFARPSGPAFNLLIQPDTSIGIALSETPATIIALGHFDDHRSTTCPAGDLERCRRNFVVDALIDPADTAVEHIVDKVQQFDGDRQPVAAERDVALLAKLGVPDRGNGIVIEAVAIRGEAVPALEPIASGTSNLTSTNVVWIVRVLGTDRSGRIRVTTVLVPDRPHLDGGGAYYIPTPTGLQSWMSVVN
jgi:hypothetical protein